MRPVIALHWKTTSSNIVSVIGNNSDGDSRGGLGENVRKEIKMTLLIFIIQLKGQDYYQLRGRSL